MASQPILGHRPQRDPRSPRETTVFRRWQRFRLDLPIRLIVTRDERVRFTEGRANDICEGGVLIFAGVELRGDEQVVMEFTPHYSSTPVRATGVVRHRRGYNYGVEFRTQTRADQEQTAKFRGLLQLAAGAAKP